MFKQEEEEEQQLCFVFASIKNTKLSILRGVKRERRERLEGKVKWLALTPRSRLSPRTSHVLTVGSILSASSPSTVVDSGIPPRRDRAEQKLEAVRPGVQFWVEIKPAVHTNADRSIYRRRDDRTFVRVCVRPFQIPYTRPASRS